MISTENDAIRVSTSLIAYPAIRPRRAARHRWFSFYLVAVAVVLTAVYLRTRTLSQESVDGDELFSRRVALANPQAAFAIVKEDLVHPPLYYAALKSALPLTGATATGIRVLSLASGISSILVVLLWGVFVPRLKWPALLAAGLIALNPTHIFYSQQARSYALYGLLVCLLLLWSLVMHRYWDKRPFWLLGAGLMIAVLYTHYVGALFIGSIVFATLLSGFPRIVKIRMTAAAGSAFLAFVPWVLTEIAVYRNKHGFGGNISWQGLPTFYDLRSLWASFLGIPNVRGGSVLALLVGAILVAIAVYTGIKDKSRIVRAHRLLLLSASVLPPVALFATSFKPFQSTAFNERHLLPAIFPWLVLVATGLLETAAWWKRPKLPLALGVCGLCVLEISELSATSLQFRRQPYAMIADALRTQRAEPIYTTWPYGIGATVNFYLNANVAQPIESVIPGDGQVPKEFILLYRPAIKSERNEVESLLAGIPHAEQQCRYYASPAAIDFGTRVCNISRLEQ